MDLNGVLSNLKNGWILNPNEKIVNAIIKDNVPKDIEKMF